MMINTTFSETESAFVIYEREKRVISLLFLQFKSKCGLPTTVTLTLSDIQNENVNGEFGSL